MSILEGRKLIVPKDMRDSLLAFPQLSHAQCDAIAQLAETMKPDDRMDLMQTYTDSGGTHLYVRHKGQEFHVAANGNATLLNEQAPDLSNMHPNDDRPIGGRLAKDHV